MKQIIYNARFTTLDPQNHTAEAVYVENGRFAAIGSAEDILLQYGRADVERIDLQGGYAYPGFVDNHLHLAMQGMKLSMLDFSETTSKEAMLHLLRQKVSATPVGKWVLGLNWNENLFADRAIPTIDELDTIAPSHPVLLTRTDYHTYLANTRAFQEAGIAEFTPDPEDGAFGRDHTGRFNGLIHENAYRFFEKAQPKATYDELKEYVRKGMKDALRYGFTGVHTEDIRNLQTIEQTLRIYRELVEEGNYLHTEQLIYYPALDELQELGLQAGSGDAWLRIGACKIFADGSIGGRTALLSEAYTDDPGNKGMAIHTQAEFNQIVLRARKLGMPIAVHAIGDQATEMMVIAMEQFPLRQYVAEPLRDRLIHAQVLRHDLIPRLQKVPVAIDIQPRFVASDFPWVLERIGEGRSAYAYAWRKLLDAGLGCGAGSDAPIEPLDPRLGMHAAITRRAPSEVGHEGYLPSEKLSAQEALSLFTLGSAYTAGVEQQRGSISVGKYADITVLDKDLLRIDPEEILGAKTMFTITNGQIGYRA